MARADGCGSGGPYRYLFVEDTLLRLGVNNADPIVPEWQDLKIGDPLWYTPEDCPALRFVPMVTTIEPSRVLVPRHGDPGRHCHRSWQ